jgi:hypothetical protein
VGGTTVICSQYKVVRIKLFQVKITL